LGTSPTRAIALSALAAGRVTVGISPRMTVIFSVLVALGGGRRAVSATTTEHTARTYAANPALAK
jgi:hypothetical protein